MMRFWPGVALLCSLAVGCGETLPEESPPEESRPEESRPEESPPEKTLPEDPDREGPAAEDISAQWKRPRLELGTAYLVKDLFPPDPFPSGPLGVYKPTHLVDFQGTLYFLANFNFDFEPNPAKGELWKSDGTPEGTVPVREFRGVGELIAVGDRLFLTASDEAVGSGLWVSDGTAEGTRFILDIPPAPSDPWPLELTAVGDTLFFFLGNELWRSDGTPEGTVLVEDLGPGTRNPYSHFEKAVLGDDRLLFTFVSPEHGEEPWVSDGTRRGTRKLQEIAPGDASSFPHQFTRSGDFLFFVANDQVHEHELWAFPLRTEGRTHSAER
jgi:ELWxxDGT repeat protein